MSGSAVGGTEQAGLVMQSMMGMATSIEQLLTLLESTRARSRDLHEQLDALRAAPDEQALQTLRQEIVDVTQDANRLSQELQQAQGELQRLQNEAMPTAAITDMQANWRRLEDDQRKLEADVEGLGAAAQRMHAEAAGSDDLKRQRRKALWGATTAGASWPVGATGEVPVEPSVTPDEREELDEFVNLIGGMLRSKNNGAPESKKAWQSAPINSNTATLQSRWSQFVSRMSTDGWMDVNQLIQWVMREAYINNTDDLQAFAQRVKYFSETKKALREELQRARQFRTEHQAGHGQDATLDQPFTTKEFLLDPEVGHDGSWGVRPPVDGQAINTVREMETYIKDLETKLQTVGDDGQLAQLDLQNATQKQQQVLHVLSNLSKVLHDTSMAIIRKIGS